MIREFRPRSHRLITFRDLVSEMGRRIQLHSRETARTSSQPRLCLWMDRLVEVVQEALHLGAWGYVLKTRAAFDLLAAVDAALEGSNFPALDCRFGTSTDTSPDHQSGIKLPLIDPQKAHKQRKLVKSPVATGYRSLIPRDALKDSTANASSSFTPSGQRLKLSSLHLFVDRP